MEDYYDILFSELTEKFGELDSETLTAIVGFAVGGPVSICTISGSNICVSCELSQYPEQKLSAEGMKFELFSRDISPDLCRPLFTALGNLSMNSKLGNSHQIDVTPLEIEGIKKVRLKYFSRKEIEGNPVGLYEVIPK